MAQIEKVYCLIDYYDGPILGIADYNNHPYLFKSFDIEAIQDEKFYYLYPLNIDEFNILSTKFGKPPNKFHMHFDDEKTELYGSDKIIKLDENSLIDNKNVLNKIKASFITNTDQELMVEWRDPA